MIDTETKPELPILVILGAAAVTRMKTKTIPLIGSPGEPVAEYKKCGWAIMSPGNDSTNQASFQVKSTIEDYEQLCRLDVPRIEDHPAGDNKLFTKTLKNN